MHDLAQTLNAFNAPQLVAALAFVCGYVIAIGQLATSRGRLWGGLCSALAAVTLVALTHPWVHGAMLVAIALGGIGVFIGLAWLASLLARRWADRQRAPATVASPEASGDRAIILPRAGTGRLGARTRRQPSAL